MKVKIYLQIEGRNIRLLQEADVDNLEDFERAEKAALASLKKAKKDDPAYKLAYVYENETQT